MKISLYHLPKNMIKLFLFFSFLLTAEFVFAQGEGDDYQHEYTIFFTRPAYPLNWESPSTLYNTVKKSYLLSKFHKKGKRFLGHAAFNLKTDLLGDQGDTLWMGIKPETQKDMARLLFKEKIGLGVIGVPFHSEIEGKKEILYDLTFNNRYTEVNFITFIISRESAQQIIAFTENFLGNYKDGMASASNYYGGVFWPLYNGEGAGCSALCVAGLESGGIVMEDMIKDQWKAQVRLPMDLIGGEYNDGHEVPTNDIRKRKEWHDGEGQANIDYIDFEIYDPNYMMDWVNEQISSGKHELQTYQLTDKVQIKGIILDYSHIKPEKPLEELMHDREEPSVLVQPHLEMMNSSSHN